MDYKHGIRYNGWTYSENAPKYPKECASCGILVNLPGFFYRPREVCHVSCLEEAFKSTGALIQMMGPTFHQHPESPTISLPPSNRNAGPAEDDIFIGLLTEAVELMREANRLTAERNRLLRQGYEHA
jgi:hypothetical protein